MKIRNILMLFLSISISNVAYCQTLSTSAQFSLIEAASDSIIPGKGNRIKLRLTIPIDSTQNSSEVTVAIGSDVNKSDIFFQSYPLTKAYSKLDEQFSLTSSQILIELGEFDPDIRKKTITVKLRNFEDEEKIKKDSIQ